MENIENFPENFLDEYLRKHRQDYKKDDVYPSWDSDDWLKRYRETDADHRELRKEVWANTCSIVKCRKYVLPNGEIKFFGNTGDNTSRLYVYPKAIKPPFFSLKTYPEVTVMPKDCLEVAHDWVQAGIEVSILNMASLGDPGNGCREGTEGQEEYLFRCSSYHKSFYQFKSLLEARGYGFHNTLYFDPLCSQYGGIYSPNVVFFRKSEENGYALAEEPWKANVIAVAGLSSPETATIDNFTRLSINAAEIVKNKIRTIFRIACDQKQGNLVLGPIGCGAYHNPPKHVAKLFHEVMLEKEFMGAFKRICFAVKSDSYSNGDSTYHIFYEELNDCFRDVKFT